MRLRETPCVNPLWLCGHGRGCLSGEGESPSMLFGLVRLAVLPASPEDTQPCASEDADGVRMVASASAGVLVHGRGPGARLAGVVGPGGESAARRLLQAKRKFTPLCLPD